MSALRRIRAPLPVLFAAWTIADEAAPLEILARAVPRPER